jgi:hypothetical protein
MMNVIGLPQPAFPGAMGALEAELDVMLRSALIPGETARLRVQAAAGEALVMTQRRLIVLKGAQWSTNRRAFGRYFALDEIIRFERRGFFGTSFVAVITSDTIHERIPVWNRQRCSFGVTFSGGSGTPTFRHLEQVERWLAAQRRFTMLNGPLPTVTPVGIAVDGGERFHLQVAARYLQEKTVREWAAGSSGVSVPIVRGVRVRVGGTRGRSWSRTTIEEEDAGSLLIGDRRVVFSGSRRTVSIPLHSIASVDAYSDRMRIGIANKPLVMFVTDGDIPGLVLKRILGIP